MEKIGIIYCFLHQKEMNYLQLQGVEMPFQKNILEYYKLSNRKPEQIWKIKMEAIMESYIQ